MLKDPFVLAGKEYGSRLILGTGKYKSFEETRRAIEASGAEIVTVAVRRVNITDPNQENLLDYVDPKQYTILPNTAGCYTAEEAIRTARLGPRSALPSVPRQTTTRATVARWQAILHAIRRRTSRFRSSKLDRWRALASQ